VPLTAGSTFTASSTLLLEVRVVTFAGLIGFPFFSIYHGTQCVSSQVQLEFPITGMEVVSTHYRFILVKIDDKGHKVYFVSSSPNGLHYASVDIPELCVVIQVAVSRQRRRVLQYSLGASLDKVGD
jgi:hypothetical protein